MRVGDDVKGRRRGCRNKGEGIGVRGEGRCRGKGRGRGARGRGEGQGARRKEALHVAGEFGPSAVASAASSGVPVCICRVCCVFVWHRGGRCQSECRFAVTFTGLAVTLCGRDLTRGLTVD